MTFQFHINNKHLEFQKTVQDLLHQLKGVDETELLKRLAKEGYLSIPGLDGSRSDDYLSLVLMIEELAKMNPKVANRVVELIFAQEVARRYAKPECQTSCVNKIRNLETTINVLFSEPGNYSADKLGTKIEKTGDTYYISGMKIFAPENRGVNKYLVVGNLTGTTKSKLAIIGLDASQVNVVSKEIIYGNNTIKVDVAEIDASVGPDKLMLDINDDMRAALSIWRTLIAASAIGLSHTNLTSALNVVKGVKNSENQAMTTSQAVQFSLSDMFGEIEGARMVTYYSARLADAEKPNVRFSAIAKVQATETAVLLSNQASNLFGYYGNVYDSCYLEALQMAYNRLIKDGSPIHNYNLIYEEALAKR